MARGSRRDKIAALFAAPEQGKTKDIRITNAILTVLRMLIVSETEFLKTS